MDEMLNPDSFESFRAFTLDSIARLDEAISLLYDVEQGRIPQKALDPIFAELLWSLEKDSVAQTLAFAEIEILKDVIRIGQYHLADISAHCFLIKRLTSQQYKKELETMLIARLSDDKHRHDFRKLCGFYCSHIVNMGYSKRYVASVVEETFFTKEIHRAGARTINRFFGHFRVTQRQFVVYAIVSREFALFIRRLNYTIVAPREIDEVTSAAFGPHIAAHPGHMIFKLKQHSFDQFGAMIAAHSLITSLRAMTYLLQHPMSCEWVNNMFVIAVRSRKGAMISKIDISFDSHSRTRMTTTSGKRLKGMVSYAGRLINNFDGTSTERLFNSLNIGALARTGASQENQLISFWSAVEVLLSDPPKETPRIVHYTGLLVPCLCLRHVRRQTVALFDNLLLGYRRAFMKILNKEEHANTGDSHTNLAYLLLASENEGLRNELCELCANNPLALHRLWKFHRDYKEPTSALEAINGHEKRVTWQILRIYRARNQLVHSGNVPSYLQSLILNISEYYRSVVSTIVHRSRSYSELDIDQLVSEIGIMYRIYKREFELNKKDRSLSHQSITRLVQS